MDKIKYTRPSVELIPFDDDVIITSGDNQCIEDHYNNADVPPCAWITGYQDVFFQ